MGRFTFDDLSDAKKAHFLRWLIADPSDSFRYSVIDKHYGRDPKSLQMLQNECMETIEDQKKMETLIKGVGILNEEAARRLQCMANDCDIMLLTQVSSKDEQSELEVKRFQVTKESFPPLNCKLAYDDVKDCYVINFEGANAAEQRDVFIKHFLKSSYGSGLIDDDDDEIEIRHNKEGKFQLVIDSHDFPAVLARITKVIKNANLVDPSAEATDMLIEEVSRSDNRWRSIARERALESHLTDLKNQLPQINKELEIAPSVAQKIFQDLTSLWNQISAWIVNFKELYRKNKGSEVPLPSKEQASLSEIEFHKIVQEYKNELIEFNTSDDPRFGSGQRLADGKKEIMKNIELVTSKVAFDLATKAKPKLEAESIFWTVEAAKKGHPQAICNLGIYYAEGRNVCDTPSLEKAAEQFNSIRYTGYPGVKEQMVTFLQNSKSAELNELLGWEELEEGVEEDRTNRFN